MTTTAPRPTAVGALRARVIKFAERVTTPLVPADYLDVIDPLRSSADLRGRIVAIHPETRDAVTVVIKPGRGWRGHTPGQYVRIGVDVDGVRQWRAYSLTSERPADDTIAITVKAIPDGKVSNHLVRRATVGTIVQLDQAAGEFTLGAQPPAEDPVPHRGQRRHPGDGDAAQPDRPRAPTWSSCTPHPPPTTSSSAANSACWPARAESGWWRSTPTPTACSTSPQLDDLVDDLADRQTWACGPAGMLDALESRWAADGIADRLHTERFRPTVITAGDGGTVTFTKTGTVVDADGAQTLLDAGEAAGVLMPSGCRMGICFGCVAPLRQGAVRDLRTGDVTTAAPGDNVQIQTCVSAAAGSCDIEL